MNELKFKSRRQFFQTGLALAGMAAGGKALADICMNELTGIQPLGPFFPNEGTPSAPVIEDPGKPIHLANDSDLTVIKGKSGQAEGQIVYIRGKVTNDSCAPVANATIIIWQASHTGRYNHVHDGDNTSFRHPKTGEIIERDLDETFQYWGKAVTKEDGSYEFKTIVPGFYPANLETGWYRPPHIHFMISALGYPETVTQMYFDGDEIENIDFVHELNDRDSLLQSSSITEEQRKKLVVRFEKDSSGLRNDGLVGNFDIVLGR